jgi:uncharacterized repeat protein (TIGR03803 family)
LVDSDLYGMAAFGGTADRGTIFRMRPDGTGYETIHSFDIAEGYQPQYSLVQVGPKLYGTTIFGGQTGDGVLFSMDIPEPTLLSLWVLAAAAVALKRPPRILHTKQVGCMPREQPESSRCE